MCPASGTSSTIRLRPYQEEALAAVQQAAARGVRRMVVQLPTGTGKSVVAAELIRRTNTNTLVLAPSDEIIGQLVATLRAVAPGLPVGIVKAELDQHDTQVIVASKQTLDHPARRARLGQPKLIIVDEAHHGAAEGYRAILNHFGAFSPGGPLVLGITATAFRGDGVGLDVVFRELVYEKTIREMVQADYLADLVGVRVKLEADLSHVRVTGGDYNQGELGRLLMAANAPKHTVTAWLDHAVPRRTLVFCVTKAQAAQTVERFVEAGWPAEMVSDATPIEERRAILRRLREGKTLIVANCTALTEGFDEPALGCVVVARPTKSPLLYAQMVGRVTRTHPGKQNGLVLDLTGATNRHDLQTVQTLVGLPLKDGESLRAGEVRVRAEAAAAHLAAVERERLVAEAVNLFEEKKRERYWISSPEGDVFVLNFGKPHGMLIVHGAGDSWGVIHTTGTRRDFTDHVYEGELTLEMATGIAEDRAKTLPVGFTNPEAWWRKAPPQPASAPQLKLLGQLRVPIQPGLTKREAGDAITLALARRVIARVQRRTA